jgi:hypothetical protein
MSQKIIWVAAITLAIAGIWGWRTEADKPIFAVSFDARQWQQNVQSEGGEIGNNGILQIRMARDLVAKNTLIGKSRTEIAQMLNQPTVFMGESQQSQTSQMRYTLRTVYRMISPIRADELIIKMDDRGKAVGAYK